jgi:hypothetical protein
MTHRVLQILATLVVPVATVPLSAFFVWLFLLGICSFPGLEFSVVCGHNAYVWLLILIPLSVYLAWKLLTWGKGKLMPLEEPQSHRGENAA